MLHMIEFYKRTAENINYFQYEYARLIRIYKYLLNHPKSFENKSC
jgi:hypothetical protein